MAFSLSLSLSRCCLPESLGSWSGCAHATCEDTWAVLSHHNHLAPLLLAPFVSALVPSLLAASPLFVCLSSLIIIYVYTAKNPPPDNSGQNMQIYSPPLLRGQAQWGAGIIKLVLVFLSAIELGAGPGGQGWSRLIRHVGQGGVGDDYLSWRRPN
jgi:hypothetical protein